MGLYVEDAHVDVAEVCHQVVLAKSHQSSSQKFGPAVAIVHLVGGNHPRPEEWPAQTMQDQLHHMAPLMAAARPMCGSIPRGSMPMERVAWSWKSSATSTCRQRAAVSGLIQIRSSSVAFLLV